MVLIVIFVLLVIYGLYLAIKGNIDSKAEEDRVNKMSSADRAKYYREQRERKEWAEKTKYNNYTFTCPMCGSKKVLRISNKERISSVAVLGVASDKIGKQYICDNCKHKW